MLLPTLINLCLLYAIIWFFYRRQLSQPLQVVCNKKSIDPSLARLSQIALSLLVGLILLNIALVSAGIHLPINFSVIALIACAPILLFSKSRFKILRDLDWHTLLFFIGLFIFMKSVWLSQYFQPLLGASHLVITHKASIFTLSVLLSQLISNVPLVALYLPLLQKAGTPALMALAAGSTIAGNLLVLGAASNVIIIQNAEKRGNKGFSFWEFLKVGIPLTLCNIIVYYIFL